MDIEFKELVAIAARVIHSESNPILFGENLKRIALEAGILEEIPECLEKEHEEFILQTIDMLKQLPDWDAAVNIVNQAMSGGYRPS